jgi:hypothetical protein
MSKSLNKNQALAEIEKQLKELELKKVQVVEDAKNQAISDIKDILENSGFSLEELFPTKAGKVKKSKKERKVDLIKIGGQEFELKGRITNDVKNKLTEIGKNPEDYDKEGLIKEFG